MASITDTARERSLELAGLQLRIFEGGQGSPLVVIHHDIGSPGWTDFHRELAADFLVVAPDLPGYGASERPSWARSVRDEAVLMNLLLDDLGLGSPGTMSLVGLGFGGWVAAEMATMNQVRLDHLVLVAPMGILPDEGEVLDQFLVSHEDYVRAGFASQDAFARVFTEAPGAEQLVAWDICREMTTRIGWKPYMYSRQLPHLLAGVRVPTLVVQPEDDRIVPGRCAALFADALPNSQLKTLPAAGHLADLEAPRELARLVAEFCAERED